MVVRGMVMMTMITMMIMAMGMIGNEFYLMKGVSSMVIG
jgi:hypothetical protein